MRSFQGDSAMDFQKAPGKSPFAIVFLSSRVFPLKFHEKKHVLFCCEFGVLLQGKIKRKHAKFRKYPMFANLLVNQPSLASLGRRPKVTRSYNLLSPVMSKQGILESGACRSATPSTPKTVYVSCTSTMNKYCIKFSFQNKC